MDSDPVNARPPIFYRIREKYNHWLPKRLNILFLVLWPFIFYKEKSPKTEDVSGAWLEISDVFEEIGKLSRFMPLFLAEPIGAMCFYLKKLLFK